MKKIFYVVLLGLAAMGCSRDKVDFDLLDDIRVSPGLRVPLVNAHLSLGDLVKEDSLISIGSDKSISISYYNDSLFGFNAIEFVEIPEQDPIPVPLKVGDPPFEVGIALGTLAGSELNNAVFDEATLRYGVSTALPVASDVEFTFTFTNATLNGVRFEHTFVLPALATEFEDSLDISGIDFDLSNNGADINYLGMKMEITDPGLALPAQDFINAVQLSGLKIAEANGFFGQKVINIPNGQFDFDISALNDLTDGLYLANPTIRLITASSMGIGLKFKPDFFGVNAAGSIANLNADEYRVNQAGSSTVMDTTVITIDKDNSGIVDFLANLPRQITYGGQAQLNPDGVAANFISKDARMNIGMEIDIPLEITATDMRIEETIKDVNISSSDNPDAIESLALYFRTENGFPFEVDLDIAFLSENDSVLETVQIPLLDAAAVDVNGRASQKSNSEYEVIFEKEDIDGLLGARSIRIVGRLSTSNGGQDVVKMFTDYELDVQIATQTKVNY